MHKKIAIGLGILALVAIVGSAAYYGLGEQFQGKLWSFIPNSQLKQDQRFTFDEKVSFEKKVSFNQETISATSLNDLEDIVLYGFTVSALDNTNVVFNEDNYMTFKTEVVSSKLPTPNLTNCRLIDGQKNQYGSLPSYLVESPLNNPTCPGCEEFQTNFLKTLDLHGGSSKKLLLTCDVDGSFVVGDYVETSVDKIVVSERVNGDLYPINLNGIDNSTLGSQLQSKS